MKILIADDSKAMRMIVKRTLKKAGFGDAEIVEASDGAEALEAVERERPDLILCDWNMPNMNGLECLQALRERGDATPFGFVTSESTPEMRELAEKAGAAFLISKPFTADVFADRLAAFA